MLKYKPTTTGTPGYAKGGGKLVAMTGAILLRRNKINFTIILGVFKTLEAQVLHQTN